MKTLLWIRKGYRNLANDADDNSATSEEVPNPTNNDDMDIPPPSNDEIRLKNQLLKNNKIAGHDGLPAELLKAEGDKLVIRMHPFFLRNMA